MIRRAYPTALLCLSAWLAGVAQAADPEFKTGVVTASRAYEREVGSISVGGIRAGAHRTWVSRVTVGVDGERITAEWEPKTAVSATAQDFPRRNEVQVAVARNKLLLKHPDGSIVEAKIVNRERQNEER